MSLVLHTHTHTHTHTHAGTQAHTHTHNLSLSQDTLLLSRSARSVASCDNCFASGSSSTEGEADLVIKMLHVTVIGVRVRGWERG